MICDGYNLLKNRTNLVQISKGLLLILILLISCETAYSGPRCDPEIIPVDTPGVGYGPRGDRCEGFYLSKAPTESIDVIGVIIGTFQFRVQQKEVIEISSPMMKTETIHVRAVGIPIRTYYRMDAELHPGQKLRWPVADVIFPQKLSPEKIGVFGWIREHGHMFYVPVRAKPASSEGAGDGTIHLFLRASANVDNVKWRSADMMDEKCSPPGKQWHDTDRTHYRAGQPIRISLPPTRSEGLCIEVAAKDQRSNRWLKQNVHVIMRKY